MVWNTSLVQESCGGTTYEVSDGSSRLLKRINGERTILFRFINWVATTLLSVVLLTGTVSAQTDSGACGNVPGQFQAIAELLTRIQQLGVALGLLIAALMYVWAGILWMRGTPDSQQRARRIFMNTTIGLVLILIAGGLVSFIKTVLCGGG